MMGSKCVDFNQPNNFESYISFLREIIVLDMNYAVLQEITNFMSHPTHLVFKRNCQGNKRCCFCANDETIQHLFFDCRFAHAVSGTALGVPLNNGETLT
jgi:hypothetical protein